MLKLNIQLFADNKIVIEAEIGTKKFDRQIDDIRDKLFLIDEKLSKRKQLGLKETDIAKLTLEAEKLNNKLAGLYKQQTKINQQGFSNIGATITGIGNKVDGVIKKVAKWSLAVIGLRSVYLGIRSAMSTLTQYDKQLQANVDYLKFAIANSIRPIIEWILNAIYTILKLVGQIIYTFTGYNIFEKSGIKDYQKAMASSNKSAKDLKKTLAGFDEMNVINENGTTGGVAPNMPDLSDTTNFDKWVEDVKKETQSLVDDWFKMGDEMKQALANPQAFDEAYGEWSQFIQGITEIFVGFWDVITGIVGVVGSVIDIIVGLFTGNFELIGQGWETLCKSLWMILSGALEIIVGLIQTAWGIIVGIVTELWNSIVNIVKGVATWIYDYVIKPIADFFAGLWNKIKDGVKDAWTKVKEIVGGVGTWIKDKIVTPVGNFFKGMWNGFKDGAKKAWEGVKNIFGKVADFFKNIFSKAWEGVKKVFSTGGAIFKGIAEGIFNVFKKVVNAIIDGINSVVAIPFNAINGALGGLKKVDLWGWKPFEWLPEIKAPQIPHLAKGTILNNPGKGVPVANGSAIAGESGREAYLPLSDTQLLEELGSTIGRYVNINATIPVYVGNRQIAREIQKINAENDFAYNR